MVTKPKPIKPAPPMTLAQKRVLAFIQRFRADNGFSPSLREIAGRFGWNSPNSAMSHVNALARKGAVRITSGVARGIVPVEK